MWTGWVGNDGSGGGPVIDNAEAGYDWSTYPGAPGEGRHLLEDLPGRRRRASTRPHYWGWADDAYIGNYGDNSLLYFHQYQNAPAAARSRESARTGTNIPKSGTLFDIFRAGRRGQQAAAGVVDRRARGLHRAPELAGELRRLVRLADPRRADRQSRRSGARPSSS